MFREAIRTPEVMPSNPVGVNMNTGWMVAQVLIPRLFMIKIADIRKFLDELLETIENVREPQGAIAKTREKLGTVWGGQAAPPALKDLAILDGCFKTTNDGMERFANILEDLAEDLAKTQGKFNKVAMAANVIVLAQMCIPIIGKGLAKVTSYICVAALGVMLLVMRRRMGEAANAMRAEAQQAGETITTAGAVASGANPSAVTRAPSTGSQTLQPNVINSGGSWIPVDPGGAAGPGGGAGGGSSGSGSSGGGDRIVIERGADGVVRVEMGQPDHDVSLEANLGGEKISVKYDGDGDGKVGS